MGAAHATAVNVAQLANRIVADAHAAEAEKNRDDATVAVVWCQVTANGIDKVLSSNCNSFDDASMNCINNKPSKFNWFDSHIAD